MDQLSAHLDRGWDLLQRGDLKGARASARRALETEKNSPEAFNLLGFVAAQEGDADEALESYRQAMALDDGYIDPMLNAAEVLIHPMREWDEAIALCDEVLEFAEGKEEVADALLLKFDALLGKGERDSARKLLDSLPEGPFDGPVHPFLIGRAFFEVGDTTKAEPHLRTAVERDPQNSDAHYYMGLISDEKQDVRNATLHFLESREIDLTVQPPPWAPSKEAFQKAVEKALSQLEADIAKNINDALVLVAETPGMEVVAEGVDPRTPTLLDGLASGEQTGPLATRVFIYQRNIERLCGGIEQIEEEIAFQLTEEIQHTLAHRGEDRPSDGGKFAPRGAALGGDGVRSRDRDRDRDREREKTDGDDGKVPSPRTRKA